MAAVIITSTACFSTHFGGKGTVRYLTLSPALRTNSPSILQKQKWISYVFTVLLSVLFVNMHELLQIIISRITLITIRETAWDLIAIRITLIGTRKNSLVFNCH